MQRFVTRLTLLAFLCALTRAPLNAGVVLMAEVPDAIKTLLKKGQDIVQEKINELNAASKDRKFAIEISSFAPHMTLAYITDKELSMDELEKEEPTLIGELEALANQGPIDMSEGIKDSKLEVWTGKWERSYEGKTYKNYNILAIKMKASPQLVKLVDEIYAVLEKHPTAAKRAFPEFNAHVNIGWLYSSDDVLPTEAVDAVKPALEKLISGFKTEQPFNVTSFKLSTHDKKTRVFPFNAGQKK